jgi:pyrroline-5-carboxylate reductase
MNKRADTDMQYLPIAFIGAGNMSRSIISGMVANGYPAKLIIASNPSIDKLTALQHDFGIKITQDNDEAIQESDCVVLSVKPQLMQAVCQKFSNDQLNTKLFISVAAGITVERLSQFLHNSQSVIRVMPNTPSLIGKGMSGLYANASVSSEHRNFTEHMMKMVGEAVWVDEESKINGIIAAAGSSPAYFFAILEAMQQEAEAMGFDHNQSRLLVQQAMLGAAEMVCHNPQLELSELRTQVTSRAGTTAKALEYMQNNNMQGILAGAMRAAVERANEMSSQF